MSGGAERQSLLAERLAIVLELARLNARELANRLAFGGMEMQCAADERDAAAGAPASLARLEALRAELAAAARRLADDEEELAACARRLDAVDRRLVGERAGPAGTGGDRT